MFIIDLTCGFNGFGKDNCKTRQEKFKFWNLVRLILEIWWYIRLCESWCPGKVMSACSVIRWDYAKCSTSELIPSWALIMGYVWVLMALWGHVHNRVWVLMAWWGYINNWATLTHWGRVTLICAGNQTIIGSDNGLSPGRRQAIIWTNAAILLIGPLGTNCNEILSEILTFSFTKIGLNVLSAKWQPFCLGFNVLRHMALRGVGASGYVKSCALRAVGVPGQSPPRHYPPTQSPSRTLPTRTLPHHQH